MLTRRFTECWVVNISCYLNIVCHDSRLDQEKVCTETFEYQVHRILNTLWWYQVNFSSLYELPEYIILISARRVNSVNKSHTFGTDYLNINLQAQLVKLK